MDAKDGKQDQPSRSTLAERCGRCKRRQGGAHSSTAYTVALRRVLPKLKSVLGALGSSNNKKG